MSWLLTAPAAVLLVIVAALAIPVHLDLRAELTDRLRGAVRVRWLFGLVTVALGSGRARSVDRPAQEGPAKTGNTPPASRRRNITGVLRTRGLSDRVVRLVRELVAQIHISHLVLWARYGFDDPADTGQLYGALTPLLVLASVNGVNVRCTPDFAQALLTGECSGTVSVRPLGALTVIVLFLCSPPVWRAARAWRRRA